jgi:hypothetical protein
VLQAVCGSAALEAVELPHVGGVAIIDGRRCCKEGAGMVPPVRGGVARRRGGVASQSRDVVGKVASEFSLSKGSFFFSLHEGSFFFSYGRRFCLNGTIPGTFT